jgi:N-methylhydantoinase A
VYFAGERLDVLKLPSSPDNPSRAILAGLERLADIADTTLAEIGRVAHGTTAATNMVIERAGDRIGLLTTRGFGDVTFIGRLSYADPKDLNSSPPQPLVGRACVREIDERIAADGTVVSPLDVDEVVRAASALVEDEAIEALAISFVNAYANADHEAAAKRAVIEAFPTLRVTCGSEAWRRPREYERTMVAVMNAYVSGHMNRYMRDLGDGAGDLGVPSVLVTRSNGGVMTVGEAADFPVHTMLSGPAAGVVGALHFARKAGVERIVTCDLGGTSLDVAVCDGTLGYTEDAQIGDFPLFLPTVDVRSIGAGGGSIAFVDQSGLLNVGPRSAGARPGPACYGHGGHDATLTDAYAAIGVLDDASLARVGIQLDRRAAIAALDRLGARLGLDAVEAAEAVIEVSAAQIAAELLPLQARYGIDPSDFALFAYGGAGPMHAFSFAHAVGFRKVIVPPIPGLLCAWGAIAADVRFDVPRMVDALWDELADDDLELAFAEMAEEAHAWTAAQHLEALETVVVRQAHIRYVGQSFEVVTNVPAGPVNKFSLRRSFEAAYEQRYSYVDPEAPIEVVSLGVQVIGRTDKPAVDRFLLRSVGDVPARRDVRVDGSWQSVAVYDRALLEPGTRLAGPVVVQQPDSTTYVPPLYTVEVDPANNLIGAYAG